MGMPGGGCFRVEAGQITDDSELALCLALALVSIGPAADHDRGSLHNAAADMYIKWLISGPFDVGVQWSAADSTMLNSLINSKVCLQVWPLPTLFLEA